MIANVKRSSKIRRAGLWSQIGLALEYGWCTLRAGLRGDEVIVLVSGPAEDVTKLIPPLGDYVAGSGTR